MNKLLLTLSAIVLFSIAGFAQNVSSVSSKKAMKVGADTQIIDLKTGEVIRVARSAKQLEPFKATLKRNNYSPKATPQISPKRLMQKNVVNKVKVLEKPQIVPKKALRSKSTIEFAPKQKVIPNNNINR